MPIGQRGPFFILSVNSLLQFLYKHLHWVVFIALEIVCFVLLFSYNSFQGSVYLSTAGSVTARLLNGKDRVTTYFGLAEKNLAERGVLSQLIIKAEGQILHYFSMARRPPDFPDLL